MRIRAALAGLALVVPATSSAQPAGEAAAEHFHWRPASSEAKPRPWAILLPGGGGIDVFGDGGEHYFSFADRLNAKGIDVLVVHYQAAQELLPGPASETPGARIARIVNRAVAYERSLNRMDLRCDGLVVGWSFGGNGVWEMAQGGPAALPGLAAAMAYYPVSTPREGYRAAIPVTVLQGDRDQLTTLPALQSFVQEADGPAVIDVHVFPGAQHGFDINTLDGPQMEGRFEYQAAADAAADAVVEQTLRPGSLGCALD